MQDAAGVKQPPRRRPGAHGESRTGEQNGPLDPRVAQCQPADTESGEQIGRPGDHRVVPGDHDLAEQVDGVRECLRGRGVERLNRHERPDGLAEHRRQDRPPGAQREENPRRESQERHCHDEQQRVEHEDHGDTGAQPAELEPDEEQDSGPGEGAGGGSGQLATTRRRRPTAGQSEPDAGQHGEQRGRASARDPIRRADRAVGREHRLDVDRHHPDEGDSPGGVDTQQPA
jgi:hypothetical protein